MEPGSRVTRCPGTGHRFPLFWMETAVSQIVLWGTGAGVGVNIEVVSCGVAEARGRQVLHFVRDLVRAGKGARLRAVQLATCGGFPTSLPHTVPSPPPLPKVEWLGGLCRNLIVPRKTYWKSGLSVLAGRDSGCPGPRSPRQVWVWVIPMTFCSVRTLKEWHWANCGFWRVLQPRSPSKRMF